jgi:hypothetical protein
MNVVVAGAVPPDGAGTICVCGTLNEGERKMAGVAGVVVRVRVLNGNVGIAMLPPAVPKLPGDTDVPPAGASFFAMNVAVPKSSPAGSPLTVVAWIVDALGGASAPTSAWFQGGGPAPTDCCAVCGSGAGAAVGESMAELESSPDLAVTVPDGVNGGSYKASAVASLTWSLTVGKVTCTIFARGSGLVLQGPSATVSSASVEPEPFSATFPGKIFGATEDIVVTVA